MADKGNFEHVILVEHRFYYIKLDVKSRRPMAGISNMIWRSKTNLGFLELSKKIERS
jgi:hypothetical protein